MPGWDGAVRGGNRLQWSPQWKLLADCCPSLGHRCFHCPEASRQQCPEAVCENGLQSHTAMAIELRKSALFMVPVECLKPPLKSKQESGCQCLAGLVFYFLPPPQKKQHT